MPEYVGTETSQGNMHWIRVVYGDLDAFAAWA